MTTATTVPRWFVIIDPHGAANVVSDLAPGPMAVLPLLKPAGPHARGDWRYAHPDPRAMPWDAAVTAMNAHNGRVSPHARISPPAHAEAETGGRMGPEVDATAGGDSTAATTTPPAAAPGAVARARDASIDLTTIARNRLLATVGERWCPSCRAALPLASFGGHARRGYQAWCRTCMNRATSARGGRVRRVRDTTGLTRVSAEELRATAAPEKPKPLPTVAPAATRARPSPPTTLASPHVARRPDERAPAPTPAPTMQPRLACGCTVTYNCTEAETLRARCTLAQRAVKAERQAGGVSPAATQASADALRAYHAHRGPFVPGGERGA